jgi:hypothetical protein
MQEGRVPQASDARGKKAREKKMGSGPNFDSQAKFGPDPIFFVALGKAPPPGDVPPGDELQGDFTA